MEVEPSKDGTARGSANNSAEQDSNACGPQNSRHLPSQFKNDIQEMFDRQMKVISALMVLLLAVVIAVVWTSPSSLNVGDSTNSQASDDIRALHEKLSVQQTELKTLGNELKTQQKTLQQSMDSLLVTINNYQQAFSTAYREIQKNFTSTASELSKHFWMMANLKELHQNHTADFADFQEDVTAEFELIHNTDSEDTSALQALLSAVQTQQGLLLTLSNATESIQDLLLLVFAEYSTPITNYTAAMQHSWSKVAEGSLLPTPYSISVVNDQLWCSCDEGGIVIYDTDLDLLRMVSISGLGVNYVKDVAQMRNGDVVIATADGLYHFDSQSKFTYMCM